MPKYGGRLFLFIPLLLFVAICLVFFSSDSHAVPTFNEAVVKVTGIAPEASALQLEGDVVKTEEDKGFSFSLVFVRARNEGDTQWVFFKGFPCDIRFDAEKRAYSFRLEGEIRENAKLSFARPVIIRAYVKTRERNVYWAETVREPGTISEPIILSNYSATEGLNDAPLTLAERRAKATETTAEGSSK